MKIDSKHSIGVQLSSILFPFIFFQLFTSCTNNSENPLLKVISQFPEEISLNGQAITDVRSDFYPRQMGLFDNLLVFCDWENSPYFHVYNLPDFDFMGNFGLQGRGPGEYLDPVFWGQFQQEDSIRMWVHQMNINIFSLVNIEQSLVNKNYTPQTQILIPHEFQTAVNLLAISDSIVIGSGISADGEFFFFYPENETLEWKDFRIDYTKNVNSFFRNNLDYIPLLKQGVIKVKPDQKRFVKAMVYAPIIDVFFPNGDIDFSIVLKDFTVPDFLNGDFNPNTKAWYENIFLTDDFIYALNRNCSILQYAEGECNNVEIHVYNWRGEPVKKYLLNDGIAPAAPFAVDEQNQKIYSLNFKESEDFLYVFNLNKDN